ncbi:YALIA101S02e01486g1_1 [Yarrowia lipolytica]|nr:COP1-interactive protein 1 [Yarrowia lipolytica]SEI31758.1 YALIA101S02e01486g1_1 [Yarrowia lipolytica]
MSYTRGTRKKHLARHRSTPVLANNSRWSDTSSLGAMDSPKPPTATQKDLRRDISFHVATPDRSAFIGADDSPTSESGDQFFLSGWNGRVEDYSYQSIFSSDDGDSLTGSQFSAVLASAPHVFVRPPFEAVGESAFENSDSDSLPHSSMNTTIDKDVHRFPSTSPPYTKDPPTAAPTTLGAHQEASHIPQDIPDPQQAYFDYASDSGSDLSSCATTPTNTSAIRHRHSLTLSPTMSGSTTSSNRQALDNISNRPNPRKRRKSWNPSESPVRGGTENHPIDNNAPVASSSVDMRSTSPSPAEAGTSSGPADTVQTSAAGEFSLHPTSLRSASAPGPVASSSADAPNRVTISKRVSFARIPVHTAATPPEPLPSTPSSLQEQRNTPGDLNQSRARTSAASTEPATPVSAPSTAPAPATSTPVARSALVSSAAERTPVTSAVVVYGQEPPAQEPPVQEMLVPESPVPEPPVPEPPVPEPPAQEPPVPGPPAQEPPVQETLVPESQVQEPPVPEPPMQEPSAQEPHVQEPRVEQEQPPQVAEENEPAVEEFHSPEEHLPMEDSCSTEESHPTEEPPSLDEQELRRHSDTFERSTREQHEGYRLRPNPVVTRYSSLSERCRRLFTALTAECNKVDALKTDVANLNQTITRLESTTVPKQDLVTASDTYAMLKEANTKLRCKLNSSKKDLLSTMTGLADRLEALHRGVQDAQSHDDGLWDDKDGVPSSLSCELERQEIKINETVDEANKLTLRIFKLTDEKNEQAGELEALQCNIKDSFTHSDNLKDLGVVDGVQKPGVQEPASVVDNIVVSGDPVQKSPHDVIDDEKDALRQSVERLEAQIVKLQRAEKVATKRIADSKATEVILRERIAGLEEKLEYSQETTKERMDELLGALDQAQQERTRAVADLEAKQEVLAEKSAQQLDLSACVTSLESQLKSAKIEKSQISSTLTSSQEEISVLTATVARLESAVKDKDDEILALSNQVKLGGSQASSKVRDLECQLEAVNKEFKQLENNHTHTKIALNVANRLKATGDENLAEAKAQIHQLKTQLETDHAQLLGEQEAAESGRKELEGQIRALAGQVLTCTAYTPIEVLLSGLQQSIDTLKTTQAELKRARASVSAKFKEECNRVESLQSQLSAEREDRERERLAHKSDLDSYVLMSETLQKENDDLSKAEASNAAKLLEATRARARLESSERVLAERCRSLEALQERESLHQSSNASESLRSAELNLLKREKERLQLSHDREIERLKLEIESERQRRLDSENELARGRRRETERHAESRHDSYRDSYRDYEPHRRRESGDNVRVNINIGSDSGYGGKDPALVSLARQKIEMFLANERYRRCAGSMTGAAHDDEYNRLQLYLVDSMGVEHARRILTMLTRQLGQPVTALPNEIDKLVGNKEVLRKSLEFIDDVVRYSNNDPDGPGIRAEPGSIQWSSNLNSEMSHLKRTLYKSHTGRRLRY